MTPPNVRELSERVETLLGRLEPAADAAALLRTLVTLYGEGLTRILKALDGSPDRDRVLAALCADDFVASLLIVHDLHPVPLEQRIQEALENVRPYLRSHGGEVEIVDIGADGVLELQLRGTCDGCPSSSMTLKLAVERAIHSAAPEIVEVRANTASAEPPLPLVSTWETLEGLPDVSEPAFVRISIANTPLLLFQSKGQPYAYRDRCPSCLTAFDEPVLVWPFLRCSRCDETYDVVRAGKGSNGKFHLDPLPIESVAGRLRVAIPAVT